MKKSVVGWTLAGILAIGGVAFAYLFWFAGGSGEPTTDLTTPPLADATTTTADDEPGTTSDGGVTTALGGEQVAFVIDPGQSIARFELDEVLRGEDTHVVGTTDQVAGQVQVDLSDLSDLEGTLEMLTDVGLL